MCSRRSPLSCSRRSLMKAMQLLVPVVVFLFYAAAAFGQNQPTVPYPAATALDQAITDAINEKLIPGAVLIVGHSGQIVYEKAYGARSIIPRNEPMTMDTI